MEAIGIISNTAALFTGWLFVSAGLHKLAPANRHYYAEIFRGYGLGWTPLLRFAPRLLGLSEVLLALALLPAVSRPPASFIAAALLLVYLLAMAYQLVQGKSGMDCGCAGPGDSVEIHPILLLRNGLLVLIALLGLLPAGDLSLFPWFLSIAAAALLGFVYASAQQLIANEQRRRVLNL